MLDLVVGGGTVVDGTGAPGYRADVGVAAGTITAIGDLRAAEAADRLDATGHVVAPGFIDPHTHSDRTLLVSPEAHSKVRQGVTTEVIGNCGASPAPCVGPFADEIRGQSGDGSPPEPAEAWETFGSYLDTLRAAQPSVNVLSLVGHVTLRIAAMGFAYRPPTPEELARQRELLVEALDAGALGLSSGLMTPPSNYSETEELVSLAETLHEHEAFYFTHVRGEGAPVFRATAEAIEIAERARVPVQIAHHKAAFRPNWGRMPQVTQLSVWAQERGVDSRFDVYPYTAGSAGLTQIMPDWAHEGGRTKLLDRLRDPATRVQVCADVEAGGREWDRIYITAVQTDANRHLEGRTIAEIAADRHVAPVQAFCDILLEEDAQAGMLHFIMDQDDVDHVVGHPLSMIGSDGSSLRVDGPLGAGKPHPRNYGAFPRVLQEYVRERGLLTLECAVHKMSGATAERLGLRRKGFIRYGMDADLVVFDPASVREMATYGDPHQYAAGIPHVVVNGTVTVRDGEHNGARAGRVVRRQDR